jgi:hypothetical protein
MELHDRAYMPFCAGTAASIVSSGSDAKPRVLLQQLDGTAIYGHVKPFVDPSTSKPTALSQVEVEAEADRIRICNAIAAERAVRPTAPTLPPSAPKDALGAPGIGEEDAEEADAAVANTATAAKPADCDAVDVVTEGSTAASASGENAIWACAAGAAKVEAAAGAAEENAVDVVQGALTYAPVAASETSARATDTLAMGAAVVQAALETTPTEPLRSSIATVPEWPAHAPAAAAFEAVPTARPSAGNRGKPIKAKKKAPAKEAVLLKYEKVFAKYATPPSVHGGHYLCDLGHIVKGLTVSRKIVLQNTSTQAVHLAVDKALLDAYGCALTPEKLQKLAGVPVFEATELILTMNTKLAHVFPGKVQFVLPLTMHNGPPVLVSVRADVSVPEVTCSNTVLAFGPVQWGMAKVIVVRLSNPCAVAAEWSFRPPMEAVHCKNWEHYRCKPTSGSLPPGRHTDIKVFFTPDHPQKHPEEYPQDLPLRVVNNPRVVTLFAHGSGILFKARITPKALDLGAVLPSSVGVRTPISNDLVIKNRGSAPIEVVALDFDTQYLEEEAMLTEWQGYCPELGYALLRPRAPGGAFWEEVAAPARAERAATVAMRAAEEDKQERSAVKAARSARRLLGEAVSDSDDDDNGERVVPDATSVPEGQPERQPPSAAEGDQCQELEGVGELVSPAALQQTTAAVPKAFFAIVTAFVAAEEDEQAARLAARYGVPVTTFTDLVLDAGELECEHYGTPFKGASTFGDFLYEELIGWECEKSAGGGAEASRGPGMALPSAGLPKAKPHLGLPPEDVEALFTRALEAALRQPKFTQGCVVKGLRCEFAPPGLAVRVMLQHLQLEISTVPIGNGLYSTNQGAIQLSTTGANEPEEAGGTIIVWSGQNRLWFVTLGMTVEDAEARRHASLSFEQLEAEQAAVATVNIAADLAKTKTTVPKKPTPPKGKKGAPEELAGPIIPDGIHPQLGARFFLYDSELKAARAAFLAEHPESAVQVRAVALGKGSPESDDLHAAITGLRFDLDVLEHVMPLVDADSSLVAPPYLLQVVRRPAARKVRPDVRLLKLVTVLPPLPPAPQPASLGIVPGKPLAKGMKPEAEPKPKPTERLVETARWVLQPDEVAVARLQFCSAEVISLDTKLAFEVCYGDTKLEVPVKALCAYPSISTDPRNVFPRRVKARPGRECDAAVCKQYVTNRKRFEFGPLLAGVAAAAKPPEHCSKFRITNSGPFKLKAALAMKSMRKPVAAVDDPTDGRGSRKEPSPPKGKGQKRDTEETPPASPFLVEPEQVELKEGETADVTVWCFPPEAGEVADALLCVIENNPVPVEFPMTALGTVPLVDVRLEGDAPENGDDLSDEPRDKERQPNKMLEEGIVFSRLMPSRKDIRCFKVTNISRLPLTWALTPTQNLPEEFAFYRRDEKDRLKRVDDVCGVLTAFETTAIYAEFASRPLEGDAAMQRSKLLEAELQLEVQDAKKQRGVSQVEVLWLRAETYLVDVHLDFPSAGFEGLDYGTIKVRHEHWCSTCDITAASATISVAETCGSWLQ